MDFLILSFKDIRIVHFIFTDQFVLQMESEDIWSGPHFFRLFEDQVFVLGLKSSTRHGITQLGIIMRVWYVFSVNKSVITVNI